MAYEIKKLLKADRGDCASIADITESLATFYDPGLMITSSERLLKSSSLSEAYDACMRSGNTDYFKAFSASLAIKSYGGMFDANLVSHMYNVWVLEMIKAQHVPSTIRVYIDSLVSIISNDIMVAVTYNHLNEYITFLREDYNEKLDELLQFFDSTNYTITDDDGVMPLSRYEKIYREIEGAMNITSAIDGDGFGIDDDEKRMARLIEEWGKFGDKHIMTGIVMMEEFKYNLHRLSEPLGMLVGALDECNLYIDDIAEDIVISVPDKIRCNLVRCINVVREYLADALASKLKMRSLAYQSGAFDSLQFQDKDNVDSKIFHARDVIVSSMKSIYSMLRETLIPDEDVPTMFRNRGIKESLDVMKVITDYIEVDIRHNVLEAHDDKGLPISGDAMLYMSMWHTELHKAYKDVLVDLTDTDILSSHDGDETKAREFYERMRGYKNISSYDY